MFETLAKECGAKWEELSEHSQNIWIKKFQASIQKEQTV